MSYKIMDEVMEYLPCGGSKMAVMVVLARYANEDGICWPSVATIARCIDRSRSQTQRLIHELIRFGYIVVLENEHGGAPGSTRRMKLFPKGDAMNWTGRMGATGRTDATGSANATGRVNAQEGSHRRTGGVASARPKQVSEPVSEPIPLFGNSGLDQASPDRRSQTIPECPHQEIIDAYHELIPTGRQIRSWGPERQKNLRARWREKQERQDLDWWRRFFAYCAKSEFLTGQAQSKNGRDPFVVSLDWLMRPENFAKAIEGRYHKDIA